MRVLVTGAVGYVGSWLCPELSSRGHDVCETMSSVGEETIRIERVDRPASDGRREYGFALKRDPCSYCGGPGGTIDHLESGRMERGVIPWWQGNLVGACEACNWRKDTLRLLEFLLAERGSPEMRALGRHYPGSQRVHRSFFTPGQIDQMRSVA